MSQPPYDRDESDRPDGPDGSDDAQPLVAADGVPDVEPGGTDEELDPEEVPGDVDMTVELVRQLDERTADLQRLQAEYVNYKRRVDRDREMVRDTATAIVLTGLLGVLDDLDRARQHGELTGGFKAVADSLERTLSGLGLQRFGEPGEAFDPRVHEALMHEHSDGVDGPTAQSILQPGYRVGERVLRPARVAVTEPHPRGGGAAAPDAAADGGPTAGPVGDEPGSD